MSEIEVKGQVKLRLGKYINFHEYPTMCVQVLNTDRRICLIHSPTSPFLLFSFSRTICIPCTAETSAALKLVSAGGTCEQHGEYMYVV